MKSARILIAAIALLLAAPAYASAADKGPVRLAYVGWKTEIASAYLVKAVVETRLGRECRLSPMTAEEMWASVADGRQDALVGAWLPKTQSEYMRKYGAKAEDLGPNLKGARIGLVVPDVNVGRLPDETGRRNEPYVTVRSIPELAKHAREFRGRIIGIDPGAGIMLRTQEALEAYGLGNFRLVAGDEQTMTEALSRAIRYQEWIVVTGWTPHWKFGVWKLRFLEDPKNVFGGSESIHTFVRRGLSADMPDVHRFLDRFEWTPEEMSTLMTWIELDDGLDPYGKALRWVETHPGRVDSWLAPLP